MHNYSNENYQRIRVKIQKSLNLSFDDILKKLKENIFCVGSGSSYSTAYLFSKILRNIFNKRAFAMTPRELLNEKNIENISIIIFSYSGTTKDTIYLRNKYPNSILVCGRNIDEFKKKEGIFSYYTGESYERGRVLYENILIPITILMNKVKGFNKLVSYEINTLNKNIFEDNKILRKAKSIAIFGGDFCETACMNICNKILETGIINFDYYDKKDFSHGQYVYFCNRNYDCIFYFKQKKISKYEKQLIKYLQQTNIDIVFIESPFNNIQAEYDLIYKSNILFNYILESKNIIVKKPLDAEQLYKYEGDFS